MSKCSSDDDRSSLYLRKKERGNVLGRVDNTHDGTYSTKRATPHTPHTAQHTVQHAVQHTVQYTVQYTHTHTGRASFAPRLFLYVQCPQHPTPLRTCTGEYRTGEGLPEEVEELEKKEEGDNITYISFKINEIAQARDSSREKERRREGEK